MKPRRCRTIVRRTGINRASLYATYGDKHALFLANTALELSARDREARAMVASAQEEVEAFVERMVRQGQARDDVSLALAASETACGLLASMLGGLIRNVRSTYRNVR